MLSRVISSWGLNILKNGNSVASLGNLSQCLTNFAVKVFFFLVSTQNFCWCKLCALPVWFHLLCNLSFGSWSNSKIPHFLFSRLNKDSSLSPSLYVMYLDSAIIFVAMCWTSSIMWIFVVLWSPKQSVWNKPINPNSPKLQVIAVLKKVAKTKH